ncbi:MAG: hypothetical protein RL095_2760 [Verrucomicrobiota bacterium]
MRIDIELDESSSQHLLKLQAETDLDFDEIVAAAILAYKGKPAAPAKNASAPVAKAAPAKKAQGKS